MKKIFFNTVAFLFILGIASQQTASAQYKSYKISAKGDTINIVDNDNKKQGKWVVKTAELRGNPGFEEEGVYKKDLKEGIWRKYNLEGDLLAVENYFFGEKDGLQQYYTFLGNLEREESWKAYNPDAPYDTIAVYGTGSGEVIDYKIVKAAGYAVKHGDWKYYNPETGQLMLTEKWALNNIVLPESNKPVATTTEKKKVEKTPEMLKWELKNKGKKNAIRDGRTGL